MDKSVVVKVMMLRWKDEDGSFGEPLNVKVFTTEEYFEQKRDKPSTFIKNERLRVSLQFVALNVFFRQL